MTPNPFLTKLGYSSTDRVVIIHTDDIGMCHASLQAFKDFDVDTHMGTIMNPLFIQSYIQAAASRQLPSMLPRLDAKGVNMTGIGVNKRKAYEPIMDMLLESGLPMLEGLLSMPLNEPNPQGQIEIAKDLLGDLPVGSTHFVLHPSIDTAELRSICLDWESRVANYNTFMSDELKKFIEQEDIKLIGYRQIRNAMRN